MKSLRFPFDQKFTGDFLLAISYGEICHGDIFSDKDSQSPENVKIISERDDWKLEAGRKYFFTRNYSTIVAFAIGKKYVAGNGFHIIGAHTDSPCLKLKPVSKITKGGCLEVGVQTYGCGLWYTWFDPFGGNLINGPGTLKLGFKTTTSTIWAVGVDATNKTNNGDVSRQVLVDQLQERCCHLMSCFKSIWETGEPCQ
ncbi:Peptidase M18 protein [Raphanus sativus]|nr:Peptidase M18 protein [Raphanus sativus]